MRSLFLIFSFIILSFTYGQESIWIKPNKGQWHENVKYKILVPGGAMFIENKGFTYNLTDSDPHNHLNAANFHEYENSDNTVQGHAVQTKFIGANSSPEFEELKPAKFYENYFLGNDSSRWVSNLSVYNQINYLQLYDGIDLKLYESEQTLKYDIIVAPHADHELYQVSYSGQDDLFIKNGELMIRTSVGTIIEKKPVAYQQINLKKIMVPCEYELKNNILKYKFPSGYDKNYALIIDPVLDFSTFSGATSDNWGMTATPDMDKNMIASGIIFGTDYPVSIGAYNTAFNGGQIDVVITKFNYDGTDILFSTFLGGNEVEAPQSLIVNSNNELYILGVTSSSNFPVNGYDMTHAGGPSFVVNGLNFSSGTDIFITKLNANGTALMASTYFGGSAADGISNASSNIAFNYQDQFRAEIVVDDQSNVYICSNTQSTNINIVGGFQNTLNGTQDAIIAKFNPSLSSLLWITFLGGAGIDCANSIDIDGNGNIFVGGGTESGLFPGTTLTLNIYNGGTADGYITRFEAPTYNNPLSLYLGTSNYDQTYFVRVGPDNFIYAFGQTKGYYPISSGVYSNPFSGQFLHKFSNNFTSSEWSTSVGAGSGHEELSPTAFQIGTCHNIYIAGWGGILNSNQSNAVNSSSSGMPITPDAFQSTTSGNNFYLACFAPDMDSLKHSTYFGSFGTSGDHVDGGTSRFGDDGIVYHAVCGACGGNANGFPTTPGVFSETNNSPNCNLAAFKMKMSLSAPIFNNNTTMTYPQSGLTYQWLDCDNQYTEIPGATSQTFSPPYDGNFAVHVIDGLCLNDTTNCINSTNPPANIDGDNIFDLSSLLNFYPNPTEGEVTFENKGESNITLFLTSNLGQSIGTLILEPGINVLDISKFAKGIYYLVINEDGINISRKLIKY